MAIESPISIGLISRLPNSEINTAAFPILMSLALFIESPVIDLLSTSTTLAKRRQNYEQLTRFALYLIALVTFVHALVAFTPLFDIVVFNLIGAPKPVGEALRTAFAIMVPWSGFIGWRRYLQGILIRHGRTRLVGFGTLVRVSAMFLGGFLLFRVTELPGIVIAACALILSVASESIFVTWASRQVIRQHFTQDTGPNDDPLTMEKLMRFHLPLTATTLVMFLGNPMVNAALSRSPQPELSLAGWQVAATLMWMMRTIVYALPEVVITLQGSEQANRQLFRFCLGTGLICTSVMIFFAVTHLDQLFFVDVLETQPTIAAVAHVAFLAACPLPLIGALQSYVRGMLTSKHLTVSRLYAIQVSLVTLIVMLVIGVVLKWPGVVTAVVGMTVSQTLELLVLGFAWQRGRRRLAAAVA